MDEGLVELWWGGGLSSRGSGVLRVVRVVGCEGGVSGGLWG